MIDKVAREITQKVQALELWFLHSAHHLMLIDMCIQFRKDSVGGCACAGLWRVLLTGQYFWTFSFILG